MKLSAQLNDDPRTDVTGLPKGALALLVDRFVLQTGRPAIVFTATGTDAEALQRDLGFHGSPAVLIPSAEHSPFVEVMPDRQVQMNRLAALGALAKGQTKVAVAPAALLANRVVPKAAILAHTIAIRPRDPDVDRQGLITRLINNGYTRVPLAEDPGTFSARGHLVDVYAPGHTGAVRIEFDDDTVHALKSFDPETQKAGASISEATIGLCRPTPLWGPYLQAAKTGLRAACDEVDMPTTKALSLVDALDRGAGFIGLDAFTPAFFESMDTVFDFLPTDCVVFIDSPADVIAELRSVLTHAEQDHDQRVTANEPTLEFETHIADEAEVCASLQRHQLVLSHSLSVLGEPETDAPLDQFLSAQAFKDFGAQAHHAPQGPRQSLKPVVERCTQWNEEGMHVVICVRTHAQKERVRAIFADHGLALAATQARLDALSGTPETHITVGSAHNGFVWPSLGAVLMTEHALFGKPRRREKRRQRRVERATDDLRALKPNDYVVHSEHGVGRYEGIARKTLQPSQYERLQGKQARHVEVVVIAYAGGDKLFLPVTRLGAIQKFSAKEGSKTKLDRLGGATFNTKKRRVRQAVRQLAEELLKLYAARAANTRPPLPPADTEYAEFEARFAFEETRDQATAIDEVLGDLERSLPMDRLVCGDVGFGKTEVAMRAAYRVAMSGKQVAVLCPTTVLAQQHYRSFTARFGGTPVEVRVLSRFVSKKQQVATLTALKNGTVDLVIGTHRLLSKDVHFKDLGLLVVDEEHRFGVAHKERIKKLKSRVDVLTLSATPIPRTMQLAVGGIRDLSLINTAPADRRAVRTLLCRWDKQVIKDAVNRELNRGGQVFFVYNRIDGLHERAQRLQDLVPHARIAVAHGRMKEASLERTMTDFVDGKFDVLCSTAIVESGLDIPRANTMLIDRADLFGLSQLYQLRGRVGRSNRRAYCYLITPSPTQLTDEARLRLSALEKFAQLGAGFQIATLDMELRGAGDVLGAEQSGSAAMVGFDLFVRMLSEAVAELKGEPVVEDIDPELTFDVEHYLPDDYVEDVGLRLSLYRRLATARHDDEITELMTELEDRFGPPPPPAVTLCRVMSLQPMLRAYRAVGCEGNAKRVTLHLRHDTPLDSNKILALVSQKGGPWRLSPDMKLSCELDPEHDEDAIEGARRILRALASCKRDDAL